MWTTHLLGITFNREGWYHKNGKVMVILLCALEYFYGDGNLYNVTYSLSSCHVEVGNMKVYAKLNHIHLVIVSRFFNSSTS